MTAAQENQNNEPAEKKSNYQELLKTVLTIAKELFIISLIFYLILFLLEIIFPGFVSYNFNLNWVLGLVLALGLIAAFAPEVSKEKVEGEGKPKILDYITSVFLGILGGVLVFVKMGFTSYLSLIVAGVVGVLIIAFSLILLTVQDEEVEEKEEKIEEFVQNTFLSRKTFIYPIAFLRLLLFKKVNFPMILILLVSLFAFFYLPQKTGVTPRKFNFKISFPQIQTTPTPTPTPISTPTPIPSEPKITPQADLLIKVLNGSTKTGIEEDFTKVLKNAGFLKVFFGKADNNQYENATIKFRPEDEEQANLIKTFLEKDYKTIIGAPSATSSAEITVILGDLITTLTPL